MRLVPSGCGPPGSAVAGAGGSLGAQGRWWPPAAMMAPATAVGVAGRRVTGAPRPGLVPAGCGTVVPAVGEGGEVDRARPAARGAPRRPCAGSRSRSGRRPGPGGRGQARGGSDGRSRAAPPRPCPCRASAPGSRRSGRPGCRAPRPCGRPAPGQSGTGCRCRLTVAVLVTVRKSCHRERLGDHLRGDLPEPGPGGCEPHGRGLTGLAVHGLVIDLVHPGAEQLLQVGHRPQHGARLPPSARDLDQELSPYGLE